MDFENLPDGWELTTLPNLIGHDGIMSDGDWVESKDQDPNGDIRLIQLADIGDGFYVNKSSRFLTYQKALDLKCTFLKVGDILIARMPDPLGRACLFPGDSKTSVTVVDICVLRTGDNGADHKYLIHLINSPRIREKIKLLSSGTTRKRISRKNLSTIEIPLAPLNEQKRIVKKVEALGCHVRRSQEALEEVPQLIEQFRQSVLAAAFRGDLTADWRKQNPDVEPASVLLEKIKEERRRKWEEAELEKMRAKGKEPKNEKWKSKYKDPNPEIDLQENDFPENWSYAPLNCISKVVDPNPSHRYPSYKDGVCPLLSTREFSGLESWKLEKSPLVSEKVFNHQNSICNFQENTIIFARKGKLGMPRYIPKGIKSTFSHTVFVINSSGLINSDYLLWYLRQEKIITWLLREMNSNTGVPTLGKKYMEVLPVILPPTEEQALIATKIRQSFETLARINSFLFSNLEELEQLNQSILAKAFRGELVPQDPNDEPAAVLLERIRAEQEKLKPQKKRKSDRRKKKTVS